MARKQASSVLEIGQWPIGKLVEYANNPRDHDSAVDKMAATIREFGFKVPIVATSKGEVVDGHLRLKAARSLGLKTVPVVLADDLSEAQIKAFRLSVNESTNWAHWNPEKLELELTQLKAMNFDLEPFGLDAIELPELEEVVTPPPRSPRNKTTIFVSVLNQDVEKARKAIVAGLNKAKIGHNL
jgi:hypothetical protein